MFGMTRKTDPITSKLAAENVDHIAIAGKILRALDKAPRGLTTVEIATLLRMKRDSISPQMKPLEKLGKLKRTRLMRKMNNGCYCIVWTTKRIEETPLPGEKLRPVKKYRASRQMMTDVFAHVLQSHGSNVRVVGGSVYMDMSGTFHMPEAMLEACGLTKAIEEMKGK